MSKLFPNLVIISAISLLLAVSSSALAFPKETLFFDRLVPYEKQVKLIDNNDILFTGIGVAANKEVTRAKITVQAMPDCPENAPYQTNVLQCFYVNTYNFDDDEVDASEIHFKVPKEWIDANNYDKDGIELRRYSYSWNKNGKLSEWVPAEISLEKEDSIFYYYKASSDGFFYFSIAGTIEKITHPVIEPPTVKEIAGEAVKEHPIAEEPIITAAEETKDNKGFFFEMSSLLLIAMASLFVSIYVPRKISVETRKPIFEQLTDYVRSSNLPQDKIIDNLRDAGWNDSEICLVLNEAKKPH